MVESRSETAAETQVLEHAEPEETKEPAESSVNTDESHSAATDSADVSASSSSNKPMGKFAKLQQ